MFDQFLNEAMELLAKGEPFVTASVVRFQAPISGKPGDKAIIFADGKMRGWIGGGCAQPVVIKEALKALADGSRAWCGSVPRLRRKMELSDYTMTCHSGGTSISTSSLSWRNRTSSFSDALPSRKRLPGSAKPSATESLWLLPARTGSSFRMRTCCRRDRIE